jgi:5-methylthioribose kinase
MHDTERPTDKSPASSPSEARTSSPAADNPASPQNDPTCEKHASAPWLTPDRVDRIAAILRQCGVLNDTDRVIDVARAGEGNMNLTLRVRCTRKSVILKQSRPWVEKYPSIAAPVERVLSELRFYEAARRDPGIAKRMPQLLAAAPAQFAIVLEDMGSIPDGTCLYQAQDAAEQLAAVLPQLLAWLERLHQLEVAAHERPRFANRDLRLLNHAHLFEIPFAQQPVIDLDAVTPGLAHVAVAAASNRRLRQRLDELGNAYLADGQVLVHGDFFPGSWLLADGQPVIIDPEFSFCGSPEFDLGVLMAHILLMAAVDPDQAADTIRSNYRSPSGALDWQLVADFSSVEVLRRLLGMAQLPLPLDLPQKSRLVDSAITQLTRR